MSSNIDFTEYDKIVDIIMWLSDTITLNFVVVLNKTRYNGEKKFFHYETMYGNDKFTNRPNRSIKRNMDFYFVLDNREVFANGLLFRPQDVYTLDLLVNKQVLPWFFGTPDQVAFKIIDEKLTITEYTPITWAQNDSRYIIFEPYIYMYEDDTASQGIKLTLYSGDVVLLTLDKFLGFMYILKSDMYNAACSNVAYARMQPNGINVLDSRGLGGGRQKDGNRQEWNDNQSTNNGYGSSFLDNAKSK